MKFKLASTKKLLHLITVMKFKRHCRSVGVTCWSRKCMDSNISSLMAVLEGNFHPCALLLVHERCGGRSTVNHPCTEYPAHCVWKIHQVSTLYKIVWAFVSIVCMYSLRPVPLIQYSEHVRFAVCCQFLKISLSLFFWADVSHSVVEKKVSHPQLSTVVQNITMKG